MAAAELIQVTYREIAESFGIGIEGARIKAKRRAAKGEWRLIPGNHPQDIVRVEMPAEELRAGPIKPQRSPPNNPADRDPTPPPQHETQRKDTNDLEALVAVVSQLTLQSQAMTDRLIEAERMRAEAQRDTAIAQTELKAIEERLAALQEQHLTELLGLRERMAAETEQTGKTVEDANARERELQARLDEAKGSLAAMHARSWWRRLVG
ncbi:hypothetical protein IPV08_23015 [Methylobacterium sp. SD274]|uniref:hypothetical protein n=1 Tax=Methylobacterium sp. SD274 TaxID=2782009 RepID=UPI001A97A34B|nr:hypothetical protein [Methylobacterium sp. SD274]MBO1022834.1 hypothetical protein [Methylobacterium sp. SD274]